MKRALIMVLIAIAILHVSGCGQKGPLVLPDDVPATQNS